MTSKLQFAMNYYVTPATFTYDLMVEKVNAAVAKGPNEFAYFLSFNDVAKVSAAAAVALDVSARVAKWSDEVLNDDQVFSRVLAYVTKPGLAETCRDSDELNRQAYAKIAREFADA
jgi:hypothetical protein